MPFKLCEYDMLLKVFQHFQLLLNYLSTGLKSERSLKADHNQRGWKPLFCKLLDKNQEHLKRQCKAVTKKEMRGKKKEKNTRIGKRQECFEKADIL